MSKIEKIYILSGGTGGHVYPAKVIAEKFLSEETEVVWIGTSRGPEKKIAENLNIKFIKIPLSGFRGKSSVSKIKALFAFILTGLYLFIKINILILGGSLGALVLSRNICKQICLLPKNIKKRLYSDKNSGKYSSPFSFRR